METRRIRLILGDQLNPQHSWFSSVDDKTLYVMAEQRSETDYVTHHAQKLIAVFSAMRVFAEELRNRGHRVEYIAINDDHNCHDFGKNLDRIVAEYHPEAIERQRCDEYRLETDLQAAFSDLSETHGLDTAAVDSEHFICADDEFDALMRSDKPPIMETFYRAMRRKTGVLMDGDEPLGGRWNFDKENRSPKRDSSELPLPPFESRDESELWNHIIASGVEHFGEPKADKTIWPVNREQALTYLNDFIHNRLPLFGKYQDAMLADQPWMYHSLISFSLNTKMLSPEEVIHRSISVWGDKATGDAVLLASLEGFVRQILGWREYMRQVYRIAMPDYEQMNALSAARDLPEWYWTGKTKMNCLSQVIGQSLNDAYAHHIQRLMISGNFALIAGVHPDQVDQWYLGVYIDAFQWVEITNTRGMSQYADGGLVATKPYAASASYIHRMSDYCGNCFYNHKLRHGEKACPFNSLYWDFMHRNRDVLSGNHRMAMMYRSWERFSSEEQKAILTQAAEYLNTMDSL